jgi:uncharacterized protein YoxC
MPKVDISIMQIIRNNIFAITVQAVGLIVLILNLWLGSKLYPLAQNIDQIATRVEAMEVEVTELKEDAKIDEDIFVKLEGLKITVDEMKTRIERIDQRLAKHMGI